MILIFILELLKLEYSSVIFLPCHATDYHKLSIWKLHTWLLLWESVAQEFRLSFIFATLALSSQGLSSQLEAQLGKSSLYTHSGYQQNSFPSCSKTHGSLHFQNLQREQDPRVSLLGNQTCHWNVRMAMMSHHLCHEMWHGHGNDILLWSLLHKPTLSNWREV
jgi:hypothetical protein